MDSRPIQRRLVLFRRREFLFKITSKRTASAPGSCEAINCVAVRMDNIKRRFIQQLVLVGKPENRPESRATSEEAFVKTGLAGRGSCSPLRFPHSLTIQIRVYRFFDHAGGGFLRAFATPVRNREIGRIRYNELFQPFIPANVHLTAFAPFIAPPAQGGFTTGILLAQFFKCLIYPPPKRNHAVANG